MGTERFPPVRRWRPVRPKQSDNNRNQSGERSVPLTIMNRCRCSCSARLLETSTESNSESVELCRTPKAKTTVGVRTRRRRGVPGAEIWHSQQSYFTRLATVREPHMDPHRAGVRWNCKPAISNAHAQNSSVFTRRRMSMILHIQSNCRLHPRPGAINLSPV